MTLAAGTRVGPFDVIGPLGAGGMGEVYRARDTRLGREVALKVLPASFGMDSERIGRFQREAQLLAALNHPNIGAIYGLEDAGGAQCLVLELVEGETLAVRLERGRMTVADALPIAREIVDALEAAHEKGIIHRDLKPSNIALTRDGHVKVLDFGLAKAMDPAGRSDDIGAAGATQSPTLTMAATQAGVILGTAAYMSPEQAKGRPADKRSDVWAFGCVLFEMLSGSRAFQGEDVSDTMAAVLRSEPEWEAFPADVPAGMRLLVRRCLDKDRRTRIPDMSVVRFLMEDAAKAPSPTVERGADHTSWRRGAAARILPWGVAAAALVAAATAVLLWAPWRVSDDVSLRFQAHVGSDVSIATTVGASAALSPDGRTMAFVASPGSEPKPLDGDATQLYVRRLDQLHASVLPGTEGASSPFFAPDGEWIGFFAAGKLKKISANGGAAVTLADAPTPRGAVWTADGFIVFAPSALGPLSRVSGAGGAVERLTTTDDIETIHRWPESLPGGRILYTAVGGAGFSAEAASLAIRESDGTQRVLIPGGYFGRYAASGHVVYMTNGTLFAAPFDADRAELTGPGVPVLEAVANNTGNGTTQIALSHSGVAVYLPGATIDDQSPISWLDASGATQPLRAVRANWSSPEFAPEGGRLAMDIFDGTQTDVWVYEWARDTLSRLTFDAADDQRPIWTPDGSRIAFASTRGEKKTLNLYWQRADGTGDVQRLTSSPNPQMTGSFHPGGRFLAYDEVTAATGRDLWILPLEGDEAAGWKAGTPKLFLQTPRTEGSPMFSPDGRWIAYISDETGRNEIYVRPFPGPGGKWQVSTGLADDPTWSPDGQQLFFASATDLRVMVAPYRAEGASFRVDKPRPWSEARFQPRPRPPSRDWALHPDGRRFAVAPVNVQGEQTNASQMVFILDFFEELRRVAKPAP